MKFRLKLTICMLWLLTAAFAVCGSLLIGLSFSGALSREKQTAFRSYEMTVRTLYLVNDVSTLADYSDAVSTLRDVAAQTDFAALRLAAGDEVLFTDGAVSGLDLSLLDLREDGCRVTAFSDGADGEFLQLSGLIGTDGDPLRLDMAVDISACYADRDTQQRVYRWVFAALALVGTAASWGLANMLTRPLSKLSRASRELARGNLSYRAEVRSGDELGELAADFNNMAGKLEKNVDELRDSMERQDRFMGSFAHELKTPMTSIIGYADLLRTQALSPADQMDAANYIFSEGKRLESLSLKLLDILVQGNEAPKLVPASPARLVTSLVEHLRPIYAEKGLTLRCKCEEGQCLLEPDLVKSLVVNLTDNARKAMDDGGYIYVMSEMTPDGCRISVLDNGRGIPEEALRHLTEAFYRVDKSRSRAQGGAGLGLTLCNEIARLHNGELRFKSREGNGTVVTAELRGGRV